MSSLYGLKESLRKEANILPASVKRLFTQKEYCTVSKHLLENQVSAIRREFIVPQLSQVLSQLLQSRRFLSVLEIGPGPNTVLGLLPEHLRRGIGKYITFEPIEECADQLEKHLQHPSESQDLFSCLRSPPVINRTRFLPGENCLEKFDLILFCHSMYDLGPEDQAIERTLENLVPRPADSMVVLFHPHGTFSVQNLLCHKAVYSPIRSISVENTDTRIDVLAAFIVGFTIEEINTEKPVLNKWRQICRSSGALEKNARIIFEYPNIMMTFTKHATALPRLTALVPIAKGHRVIKNPQARDCFPAAIVRPEHLQHVQQCVRWALVNGLGLTVVSGSHSDHCLQDNVVAVDMSEFNTVSIIEAGTEAGNFSSPLGPLVVAGSGCTILDIVGKAKASGLTVPLGAHPSVGAGSWLQGGIGHLGRVYGISSDSIIGAVIVSVRSLSTEILCVGPVPKEHQPTGSICVEDYSDLLWAVKGAGTTFGIVISVVFRAYPAPMYAVRISTMVSLHPSQTQYLLEDIDKLVGKNVSWNVSSSLCYYEDAAQFRIAVNLIESYTTEPHCIQTLDLPLSIDREEEGRIKLVDGMELFNTEAYISNLHGGHGGGKTSSFKRCLFFKHVACEDMNNILTTAMKNRPSPLCYIQILHGGAAISQINPRDTAFGCRDWQYAYVVTGVWPRHNNQTLLQETVKQWVYKLTQDLLPFSSGVYAADLGPDPRDVPLAARAFGPNGPHLAHLKRKWDPYNVLRYACPLPNIFPRRKLILLVTGNSGTGKDYCANIWTSFLKDQGLSVTTVSVSDATKQAYAEATGASLELLQQDREYKEMHRPQLTAFFQKQVEENPSLCADNLLRVIHETRHADIIFVTGLRDRDPVTEFSYLVPDSRVLEIYIHTDEVTRSQRRQQTPGTHPVEDVRHYAPWEEGQTGKYHPSFIFENSTNGDDELIAFAKNHYLPLLDESINRLEAMVRTFSNFPRRGIEFRHILGICQHEDGLSLCTSLFESQTGENLNNVDTIVSCESGGFTFASALASKFNKPLVLVREAGKLPPPTIRTDGVSSHISKLATDEKRILEMEQNSIPRWASVLVIDDVLASGRTLCAVFDLIHKAGIKKNNVRAFVVAEFPLHKGRQALQLHGFGSCRVQSILNFGGL
ncbi:hypothetical protein DM02DRAFT_697746 [Periconia macrospinosa]|uniref:FAD-binding PCMH-type domain-containing protein n=1 Tax=Periconia macrospinosa TaxID=97972 RepID=A0A2V1D799_9PLEO|nr:hypothetical protein DM02DRAFT_697746 [Periconia macrospinosa]